MFAVNPTAVLRLGLWGALSIALMTVDHRYQALDDVRDVLSTLVYPLHYLVRLPTDARNWLSENLASRDALLEENARLREKQVFLNVQLQKLTVLEAENRRLRSLLESAVNTPERVLIAELLAVDFDPYRHHILLNRGRRHGIYVGQPVLDQHGVIGQIIQVNPLTATAILITDPNHALPIQSIAPGSAPWLWARASSRNWSCRIFPTTKMLKSATFWSLPAWVAAFHAAIRWGSSQQWNLIPAVHLPISSPDRLRNWIASARSCCWKVSRQP